VSKPLLGWLALGQIVLRDGRSEATGRQAP